MATAVCCSLGQPAVAGVKWRTISTGSSGSNSTPGATWARRVRVTARLASANHGGRIAYVSCSRVSGHEGNIVGFLRGAPLRRHIEPRKWRVGRNRTRVSNPNSVRLPMIVSPSCCGLIKKVTRYLAGLLPSKAAAETIEAEVDAAAAFIQKGVGIVTDVADEIEAVANTAEASAEEIEQFASKIEDVAMEIKKKVDDVANLIEGEDSSLTQKVEQLKSIAEAKRAEESGADQATSSPNKNGQTVGSEDTSEPTTGVSDVK